MGLFLFKLIGVAIIYLIYAGLQRSHSSYTLVNGYMDLDKFREVCPEIFEHLEKVKKNKEKVSSEYGQKTDASDSK